jgi:hypothetical protein
MRAPSAEDRKLAEEQRRLHSGVATVTLAWANVENAMAILLGGILQDAPARISSAILFAPNNLETRINIVSRALEALVAENPKADEIMRLWGTLMNKLGRLKSTRNKVAHGQILASHFNGKNHVRLSAALFDFGRQVWSGGNPPGLTSGDLENSARAVAELTQRIDEFNGVVQHIHTGDAEALLRTLAELAAEHPHPQKPDTPIPAIP